MEKQNEYQVIVSEKAKQMLVNHTAFLAQVNKAAAKRFAAAFRENAASLGYMPHRCPYLSQEPIPKNTYRFLLFQKRYMLIFQIKNRSVYIDYVVDCRQDYKWFID